MKNKAFIYIQEQKDIKEVLPGHDKQIQQNVNSTANLFLKVFDTDWKKILCVSGNMLCRPSTHFYWFFFLILSFTSCLCILGLNYLSIASFANIFSYFELCLFISFMVIFPVQKLLILIGSHFCCCHVTFYFHYPRWWVKKDLTVI